MLLVRLWSSEPLPNAQRQEKVGLRVHRSEEADARVRRMGSREKELGMVELRNNQGFGVLPVFGMLEKVLVAGMDVVWQALGLTINIEYG